MTVPNYTPSYSIESPYGVTPIIGDYMYFFVYRTINPQRSDITVTMDNMKYVHRPDRLANDMYENGDLWWVFGVRNGWEDPIFDLTLGKKFYVPSIEYIRTIL